MQHHKHNLQIRGQLERSDRAIKIIVTSLFNDELEKKKKKQENS